MLGFRVFWCGVSIFWFTVYKGLGLGCGVLGCRHDSSLGLSGLGFKAFKV